MLKTLLIITAILSTSALAVDHFNTIERVQQQRADFYSSSDCVGEYVSIGIERADIQISGGTCYIKNSQY